MPHTAAAEGIVEHRLVTYKEKVDTSCQFFRSLPTFQALANCSPSLK